MGAGDELQKKPHVVAVAYPAPGHMFPCIDLAKRLASKGLSVSFVTTPGNVTFLEGSLLQPGLDIRLLVLPTPSVEGLEGRERMDLVPFHSRSLVTEMVDKLQHPFQAWMVQQTDQPVCIVYDMYISWAVDTAQKFNIASVMFNTCGAFASLLMQSMACSITSQREEEGEEAEPAEEEGEEDVVVVSFNMPSPIRFSKHEVCPSFTNPDLSNPAQRFIYKCIEEIGRGSGLLINTFHELEGSYVNHWKNTTGKPVWAIGPVNPGGKGTSPRGGMAEMDEAELVGWLDSKGPSSVVYVSFGSLTVLSKEQARALAAGLESSGEAFVWAVKMEEPIKGGVVDGGCYLPEGFVERTKGRGLVIRGWAPQLVILSHQSVGAFISHCGWNSALESISLGVPILAWPMFGDQHFNSKLFGDLGVGLRFCENVGGIPEEERVREGVRMALSGEKGGQMRERARELKEMARNAVREDGSSAADLTAFVSDMYKLDSKHTEDGGDR